MKKYKYLQITKPGILFGNAVTMSAGYALASHGHFHLWHFLATLVGLSFVIASACICNNYLDRQMDSKMARTRTRALVTGQISIAAALTFAAILGSSGLLLLAAYTNLLTAFMASLGFLIYVVLYTLSKYRTPFATHIGAIAGAIPPVVGYTAVKNSVDLGALLLFLAVALWQMPHFFAIAMYRIDEYRAANIPVLPRVAGMHTTKVQMLIYTLAFLLATLLLTLFGYTGYTYLAISSLLALIWLGMCIRGFSSKNDRLWARKMFRFSLVIIMIFCLMIPLDSA